MVGRHLVDTQKIAVRCIGRESAESRSIYRSRFLSICIDECVQSAGYFVTFLGTLSAHFINNWSLNKGLFPSSMQKYISLICGLRTSENSAWWSRSKPDNKRCVFLALKACHELPFPIHYSSTSGLREQSFHSSFFKYSSTARPQEQQIQLRLWQVLFNS